MSTNPPVPGSNPQPQKNPAPRPPMGQNVAPRPKPKMQTIVQGDIAIVTILESRILDENNINEIGKALMELVTKQYMVKMIIDMGEVKYLSSAVLRQFIALYKAIKNEKGDLKMCRVNPEVREVFKITQLDKMIEIKDDLESAVNAFKKKGGWGFLQR
jgi:anti-anti-sigma factor